MKHTHLHLPSARKVVRTEDGIVTVVLHHCKCGDMVQSRIPGEWSWDEIVPKQQKKKNSDVEFLRVMGIKVK